MKTKTRAGRNQTLTLTPAEQTQYAKRLLHLKKKMPLKSVLNRTICQDMQEAVGLLPDAFVDLLFLDPPYNLHKTYNQNRFSRKEDEHYMEWLENWLTPLIRLLKPNASIYICADWRTSPLIYLVAKRFFHIRNRITWEREKGRGAQHNWKNCSEDIWFCTLSNNYTFNIDAVKLKRRVIAPYKQTNGEPKDWQRSENGDFRITFPSNLWTDLSVPFWSMPENTDHPTQKPEKLMAKLILASTNPGDIILDPFLGSGTTSVTAMKLARQFVGIEYDEEYCCLAEKRLERAEQDQNIQGYHDGIFWDRNSLREILKNGQKMQQYKSKASNRLTSPNSV